MKITLSTFLALASLTLAACGDDSSSGGGTTTKADSDNAVSITAAEDGSFSYDVESIEAEAGTIEIDFDNPSSTPHDVQVEGPDGNAGGTDIITDDSTSTTVDLDPGDYTFYCSVPGHRDSGMEGSLKVE
jgi:plastocyanin